MRQISWRELLRNPKDLFPLPEEGVEVVRQRDSFFIYPRVIVRQNTPINPVLSDKPSVPDVITPVGIDKCMGCGQKRELFDVEIMYDYERARRRLCKNCVSKARKEGVLTDG